MADRRQRATAPTGSLIGPLVMLMGGAMLGVVVWRFLMLDPVPPRRLSLGAAERFSSQDRQSLEQLLTEHQTRR